MLHRDPVLMTKINLTITEFGILRTCKDINLCLLVKLDKINKIKSRTFWIQLCIPCSEQGAWISPGVF